MIFFIKKLKLIWQLNLLVFLIIVLNRSKIVTALLWLIILFTRDHRDELANNIRKLREKVKLIVKVTLAANLRLLEYKWMLIILIIPLITWIDCVPSSSRQDILSSCKRPIKICVVKLPKIFLLIINDKIHEIIFHQLISPLLIMILILNIEMIHAHIFLYIVLKLFDSAILLEIGVLVVWFVVFVQAIVVIFCFERGDFHGCVGVYVGFVALLKESTCRVIFLLSLIRSRIFFIWILIVLSQIWLRHWILSIRFKSPPRSLRVNKSFLLRL